MATTVTRTSGNGVPEGTVTPEEAAAIRSSVAGKEVAPSSRQQSMLFDNWRDSADRRSSPATRCICPSVRIVWWRRRDNR